MSKKSNTINLRSYHISPRNIYLRVNSLRLRYHPRKSRKRGVRGRQKVRPNIKLRELISPAQNSQKLVQNILIDITNNFKLILLTLLFKSLFFKTNLNCSYFLLIYFQSLRNGASVNMFHQKR